ncbi:hypothetical protein K490DRAFT_52621 [Saccharata proteae CBS 121410]|uniref:Uncharacterized protein n=1 Tax=Saccharata proteae CBS 121410 TaxID=1314787 RepID=A0A9P4I0R9_9PEZI|nr:hypothetical protein K490DRAFT_52621 [Saccharata proteae CBS 121410]
MSASNLFGYSRDSDAATVVLRTAEDFELTDLLSPTNHSTYAESTGSDSSDELSRVFTASDKSSTKPTSAGTGYLFDRKDGKGKLVVNEGPSSVTATHGSGSDTELENSQELYGIGVWTGPSFTTKTLPNIKRVSNYKVKKPPVVVHHPARSQPPGRVSNHSCFIRSDKSKYLRNRQPTATLDHDLEVQHSVKQQHSEVQPKALSTTRITIAFILAFASLIAIGLAVFGVCNTDKKQLGAIKAIIMGATLAVVVFTFALMIVALRDLLEILVALMLELLISAIPLFHIHDLL